MRADRGVSYEVRDESKDGREGLNKAFALAPGRDESRPVALPGRPWLRPSYSPQPFPWRLGMNRMLL
jgi:hypothetical protein